MKISYVKPMFTSEQIEEALKQKSHKPVERVKFWDHTKEEQVKYNEIQKLVTTGSMDLFDEMLSECDGELFSQKKYVERSVNMTLRNLPDTFGEIEQAHINSIINRSTSSYMSKVVELHTSALIHEIEGYKELSVPYADTVMGVDHIVSDGDKLIYIHVTSDTPRALEYLAKKEHRGGFRKGKNFINYSRDFRGDTNLLYRFNEDESTQMVNGFPLFRKDFVDYKLEINFKASKKGESLYEITKVDKFVDFMEDVIGIDELED